jgi:hypothetical protein
MVLAPPPLPTQFPCWCRAVYSWGGEVRCPSNSDDASITMETSQLISLASQNATLASWKAN